MEWTTIATSRRARSLERPLPIKQHCWWKATSQMSFCKYCFLTFQFQFNSIQLKNVHCHTNTVECIQYIYAHNWGIQCISYAHKESQYWQVNSVELIFSSFYNPVLYQQDICYSITSMARQRVRETQIQVHEPHHCYITESWEIIKMERMDMCKGWTLKCCWDSH